ncbi:hypothetical protein, partial [uncultured Akkermansia sp.]|uniref:hypothetical protein n=1 Tax=uncultured Akkermansia sp. TaxID=512294 RepID=UPI00262C09B6
AALTRISPSASRPKMLLPASSINQQVKYRNKLIHGNASAGEKRRIQTMPQKTTFFHKSAPSRERFSITGMTKGKATGVISFLLAPCPATC